ncbi:MAG TPA: M20/M25/M40 family metallo-hydrolase [Methylomirabilota bacterium]|nr:M20/M25/M40 family metallo-hydrolase [Methylomirabilota bacterium]
MKFDRLLNEFLDLVKISSVSRREGAIARRLEATMKSLGAQVEIDDAGMKVGGETGNLLAKFGGTAPGARPLLLSAHMDTVVPGENVKPIVDGHVVRSDGTTVLGGDDKSGIALIIEVIQTLQEERIPHGDLDVLFTICEEAGLLGAKQFDIGRLRARTGLVFDSDGVNELVTRAPAADRLEFRIYGVEAHAGVCPENGISAIKVAAEAITAMRLGRIDHETTANLGTIAGGSAINIVPGCVVVYGEARSRSLTKLMTQTSHMRHCFEEAVRRHQVQVGDRVAQARVEVSAHRDYEAMDLPDDAPIVRLVREAATHLQRPFKTRPTGGGCDANVLNGRGLQVANLGTGMREIHTLNEWLDLRDLSQTVELVVEVVRRNAVAR